MTATNHALTGAIIGLTLGNPLTALPLALLSHYVLDAMPHYGRNMPESKLYKSKGFHAYLLIEGLLCFLIVVLLFVSQPAVWWLAAVCAFVAAAPDLISFERFQKIRNDKTYKPNIYTRFASWIQWFEKPIGGVVELVYFIAAMLVLANLLHIW